VVPRADTAAHVAAHAEDRDDDTGGHRVDDSRVRDSEAAALRHGTVPAGHVRDNAPHGVLRGGHAGVHASYAPLAHAHRGLARHNGRRRRSGGNGAHVGRPTRNPAWAPRRRDHAGRAQWGQRKAAAHRVHAPLLQLASGLDWRHRGVEAAPPSAAAAARPE